MKLRRWLIAAGLLFLLVFAVPALFVAGQAGECGLLPTPAPGAAAPVGHVVESYQQLEQLWIDAHGDPAKAPLMAAIAEAESGGDSTNVGPPTASGLAQGLWQIMIPANSSYVPGGAASVFVPLDNAIAAVRILAAQGLSAWTTYASGAYVKFLQPGSPTTVPVSFSLGSASACASSPTVNAAGYANPYAHTTSPYGSRIDMGVDQGGTGAIASFGRARVTFAGTGVGGGWTCNASVNGGLVYQLLNGAYAGKDVYIAEDIVPSVHVGQVVQAGQQVATFTPGGCDEMGWENPPDAAIAVVPLAEYLPGFPPGGDQSPQALAAGDSMSRFLKSVGGPPGVREGAGAGVTAAPMAPGYP